MSRPPCRSHRRRYRSPDPLPCSERLDNSECSVNTADDHRRAHWSDPSWEQQLVVWRVVQADVAHVVVAILRTRRERHALEDGQADGPLHGTLVAMDELRLDTPERSGHCSPLSQSVTPVVAAKDTRVASAPVSAPDPHMWKQ